MKSALLDRGRETLTLYPEKITVNARRESQVTWDPDHPMTIKVNVVTDRRQSDAEVVGQLRVKMLRCMTRTALPGSWGRVHFRGEWWDLAEPPTESKGTSRATEHWEFAIRSRNKKD